MTGWVSLGRLVQILAIVLRHVLAHSYHTLRPMWPVARSRQARTVLLTAPERLRIALEELGGTFIKFGQMLALQPDILSLEYCNALFDLLDRIAPFDYQHVETTFVEELGKRPDQIFDSFEREPLATASIGQVHVAYLGGRKLAVKVRRPNVETDFAGDIRLMIAVIKLIKALQLKFAFWMIEPMSEFVTWTKEELDYRNEARYMEQLRRNAQDNPCEHVPETLWEYTTRRTLVVEFLNGVTVLNHLRQMGGHDEVARKRLQALAFEPDQMARNIIDNFLGDAFRYGMFHADLHPANLMILADNTVGYMDFGITGVLSQFARQNLVALTLAYTRGDLEGIGKAILKVSTLDENSNIAAYREGLRRLEHEWYDIRGPERRLLKNFSLVMLDMLMLSRKTSIWPERGVIKYIRSAIAIDGLITRFAPTFNVGQHLETVCSEFLKWQERQTLLSYHRLVDWPLASSRLMESGSLRAATFLKRIVEGELPARAEINNPLAATGATLRLKAARLSYISLALALLIVGTGERAQIGVNLFTAGATLVMISAAMFLRTVFRLQARVTGSLWEGDTHA